MSVLALFKPCVWLIRFIGAILVRFSLFGIMVLSDHPQVCPVYKAVHVTLVDSHVFSIFSRKEVLIDLHAIR